MGGDQRRKSLRTSSGRLDHSHGVMAYIHKIALIYNNVFSASKTFLEAIEFLLIP